MPEPMFVETDDSLVPILVLLVAVWQRKSRRTPMPAVIEPEVDWCDSVAAVAGVFEFVVIVARTGSLLAKVLIRSDVSLTDVADWTDSKSSVPTSDVPDGKSVILMLAMIRTRKT